MSDVQNELKLFYTAFIDTGKGMKDTKFNIILFVCLFPRKAR